MKRVWTCALCRKEMLGGKQTKKFCSAACLSESRRQLSEALLAERARACAQCGKTFAPKKSQIVAGHGVHCSHKCAFLGNGSRLTDSQNLAKAATARREAIAVKGTKHGKGAANANWKGGHEAALIRNRERDRVYLNAYRARNKEQTLEFARKRRGVLTGRLPRGTVKRIGEAQRWRCAVCRVSIADKYHMDHINPLARGGQHVPGNIQLLCPSCNVRKSAKDPIAFMQEKGYLLLDQRMQRPSTRERATILKR